MKDYYNQNKMCKEETKTFMDNGCEVYRGQRSPSPLNLLTPTGHVMHQQFNIQQLYVLPHTVFMCFVFI
jgi:hypothetical protein